MCNMNISEFINSKVLALGFIIGYLWSVEGERRDISVNDVTESLVLPNVICFEWTMLRR